MQEVTRPLLEQFIGINNMNPTVQQLNARNAAVGAPITPNGVYNPTPTAIPAPGILSTTFPRTPQGTTTTPVVTSKAADTHVDNLANTVTQSNNDIQKAQAANAAAAAAKTAAAQVKADADKAASETGSSSEDQTAAILKALTDSESTVSKPDATQQNILDTDAEQNKIDEQNLAIVGDAVDSMNAGTYPLTSNEQASVNNIATSFQTAYKAASDLNSNKVAGQNVINAKYGLQMYSPTEALSRIADIVKEGNAKVEEINTKLLDAQSKLTQAFHDSDFKTATSLYNKISDTIKQRTQEITDINKSVADATKEMHQNAKDNTDLGLKAIMDDHTISYQDKAQAISQANLDEKVKHDRAMELVKKQADSGGGGGIGSTPSVSMTPEDKPNVQDQQTFLSSLPGGPTGTIGTLVKGLADYSINPSAFSTSAKQSQGGLTQSQAVALAKQYDPTYSESQYATRQAYVKNVQSGQIYQGIIAANKSINHLLSFVDTMKKLPNGISSTANALDNKLTLNQGVRQNIATAKTEGVGVGDELAKFFKGTGTSDVASVDEWRKQLSTNASPADVKGLTQGAINLLAGQLGVLQQQYQQTMGKAPGNTFLQPQTIQKLAQLKNEGYQVDIPGINYTNKDAYFKFGGGTPEALSQAYTSLKNANDPANPPTPENVLELAQLNQ